MINRILLRIKVMQIIFAYYKNEKQSEKTVEEELLFSIKQTYSLYLSLLLLSTEITEYAKTKIEQGKRKLRPSEEDLNPNLRFIENKFIQQLANNNQLIEYSKQQEVSWDDYPSLIKSIYEELVETDFYKEYMDKETTTYQEDKNLWRKIYKKIILVSEELEHTLEDVSIYWNDDTDIVISFILKTIKQFKEEKQEKQMLLPMFRDMEDKEFAVNLLLETIRNKKEYTKLIDTYTKNWELDRISFMDVIIMQIALAELHHFPNIPVNVTLNEYIEISKTYSTRKSNIFINGVLDNIVNHLRKENAITKIAYHIPNSK